MPVVFAPVVGSKWAAVLLIGVAAAAAPGVLRQPVHDDLRHVPALGGGVGGRHRRLLRRHGRILVPSASPAGVKDATGSYLPLFVMAGSAYLIALLIVHLIVPRLEPIKLDPNAQPA